MSATYFDWLQEQTGTRVWVNNPTEAEVARSIEQGAVACTSNPAYGGNLLKRAPHEIRSDIAAVVAEGAEGHEAVELVQARLVGRLLLHFVERFEASEGREGWVSLQGAPEVDTEPEPIVESARSARALGANCIPKIPATAPGLAAMEVLVREGEPVLMTEVFSLSQVVETCERYERAVAGSGQRPALIMAPITGIFGDHLREVAATLGVAADDATLRWAGIIWARAAKRLVDERDYPVQLLYGGARTIADLTDLVGGPHAATINWSTFEEVLAADPERRETVDDEPPADIREELIETFDDVRRALAIDGLGLAEFEGFGPVQHFRDAFIGGWDAVLEAVEEERRSPVAR